MGELRSHGVEDIGRVHAAYIESDGMISVITGHEDPEGSSRKKKNRGA
jgi:uncharacterized membrane protein YcaP (DUF421 family)